MTIACQVQEEYDAAAATYGHYSTLPSGRLESQLVKIALGDCTGLTILDLGGGSGIHAREALELGAARVDVVDISPGMLRIGADHEKALGRQDAIRFFHGDASQPLSHLGLAEQGYDMVMGNWIFSFADSLDAVHAIFRNIVAYLKPGGRFVGVRDNDPWSPALEGGRYGGSCKWIERIPGGVRYRCVLHSTPPIEFDGACMEAIYSGSSDIWESFGFVRMETVPYEQAEIVQNDPEFWDVFLKRPNLAVVVAARMGTRQDGPGPIPADVMSDE
ncbi:S-adenosyl-L-methionine-dependent methyltransferase [Colletotrichum caudatum]|nr:S-adenosyl-L-methionine-dependent methyltransferase [Colletotrichum caudatum]